MDNRSYCLKTILSIVIFFISGIIMFASDAKFYSINSMYGISMRESYSICKDDNGFLWISSKAGLLRISESSYHIYQLPFQTADIISTRVAYGHSVLLAYTNNGQLFLYDELYDRFDLYLDLRPLLNNPYLSVSRIIIDRDRTFWIATSMGLYKCEKGQPDLVVADLAIDFKDILFYDEARMFIATERGVKLLDLKTKKWEDIHSPDAAKGLSNVSKLFYQKRTNRLWIGTFHKGLYYYDLEKKELAKVPVRYFPEQSILAIEENRDSTLYIGIDGQGVWELTDNGESVVNIFKEDIDNPFSLRGDGVYDIFRDDKRVWVATFSGGLSFFEQESPLVSQIDHKINNPNSLVNNHVNNVIEDRAGDIWFATDNGISRWISAADHWDTYYPNKQPEKGQVFFALCEDDQGNIWAGGYSSGFGVLDRATGKELPRYARAIRELKSPVEHVFNIFKDNSGDIWVTGINDIVCYLTKEGRFREYEPQPVISMAELSPGKILLTCTYGLLLLDKESGETELLLDGYLGQHAIVVDNTIWVGTRGNGLLAYDYETRTPRFITMESGLPSNYINSVLHSDSSLWLGTENGLSRLNLSDNTIHNYASVLALTGIAFNGRSCAQLKDGRFLWGAGNGAILFEPEKLYCTQLQGRIFFQDIHISGRSIREMPALLGETPVDDQARLSLPYYQNTLALELLPVGISSSEVKFSWKLNGLDDEWSLPANHQRITFTNIPNGDFQLQVRMYDNSASRIIDERSVDLRIIPPFWKTWWFRSGLFILGVLLILYFLKVYTNRLKQKHARDKIRFFTGMVHDLRTSLTLINAPIEELNKDQTLSERSRYYVGLAAAQSEKLSLVATQLLDFQKVDTGKEQLHLTAVDIVRLLNQRVQIFETAAQKKNIELLVSSGKESFTTAADEIKIEKVIDNLLSNAIKYSFPDSKVEITLSCTEKEWSLAVKDYGLGIAEDAKNKLFREFHRAENAVNSKIVGSGIGLLLIREYVVMHGGDISLESKVNAGSLFKVVIPFKEIDQIAVSDTSFNKPQEVNMEAAQLVVTEEDDTPKDTYILIVEDNDDLQDFLNVSFQGQYHVVTANNGKEAWEKIAKKSPDLVISDIMMPEMDGFELCERIKSTFETSHIPIILLTALSDKARQLEGLGLGADDYITKPFDINILRQRISSILKNRRIVREKAWRLISQADDEQPILTNELNDQFVKKAIEIIRENIADPDFGKDKFASAMHVSTSLLYKKLKALTDQSPTDFIKAIRLNYAMELLQSHKYIVTEVSERCGFSSSSYFSTVFKKYFGKLPTDV